MAQWYTRVLIPRLSDINPSIVACRFVQNHKTMNHPQPLSVTSKIMHNMFWAYFIWWMCVPHEYNSFLYRYPWRQDAFDKAKAEDKPIFLSVGYSTCHWCHVMERESFENESIAAILNDNFVSVKVDREERPDVDKMYMTFIQV